jgi:hypothetical protein
MFVSEKVYHAWKASNRNKADNANVSALDDVMRFHVFVTIDPKS